MVIYWKVYMQGCDYLLAIVHRIFSCQYFVPFMSHTLALTHVLFHYVKSVLLSVTLSQLNCAWLIVRAWFKAKIMLSCTVRVF